MTAIEKSSPPNGAVTSEEREIIKDLVDLGWETIIAIDTGEVTRKGYLIGEEGRAAIERALDKLAKLPGDPNSESITMDRVEYALRDIIADEATTERERKSLQRRVKWWMDACFGNSIASDKLERGDRHLEEVLELLQSGDYPEQRIYALVRYVYDRQKGEPHQEVGGVMITLAAYCLAHGLDMHQAGEDELTRIWTKVEAIRAKQAAKPTGSALPVAQAPVAHLDELAVDRFFAAMKEKLARKRAEGRGGWDDPGSCTIQYLSQLLVDHVAKGDPIDVANFAMMIHQRGGRIENPPPGSRLGGLASPKNSRIVHSSPEDRQHGHDTAELPTPATQSSSGSGPGTASEGPSGDAIRDTGADLHGRPGTDNGSDNPDIRHSSERLKDSPSSNVMGFGENRLLSQLRREAGVMAMMNEQYTARAIKNIVKDFEKKFPTPGQQASGLTFPIGSRVRKKKGSSWQGVVVGTYSTKLTPVGYAVESEREPGSVQIYPEAALENADV